MDANHVREIIERWAAGVGARDIDAVVRPPFGGLTASEPARPDRWLTIGAKNYTDGAK